MLPREERHAAGAAEAAPVASSTGVLGWIDTVVGLAVILCMACLVSIVSTQVVLRYVFDASLDWAWEASRLAFVASIFLAMPLALREGSHVGIDILQQKLPAPLRQYLMAALNAVAIGLMLVVSVVGLEATRSTWDQTMSSLPVSTGWFYVPVLWAGFHSTLHLLHQSVLLLRGRDVPRGSEP